MKTKRTKGKINDQRKHLQFAGHGHPYDLKHGNPDPAMDAVGKWPYQNHHGRDCGAGHGIKPRALRLFRIIWSARPASASAR